jgi:hypothetical protein
MSKQALDQVIQRASSDARFRDSLDDNLDGALRGYDLNEDEKSQLVKGLGLKLSSSRAMSEAMASSEASQALASSEASQALASSEASEAMASSEASEAMASSEASEAMASSEASTLEGSSFNAMEL